MVQRERERDDFVGLHVSFVLFLIGHFKNIRQITFISLLRERNYTFSAVSTNLCKNQ